MRCGSATTVCRFSYAPTAGSATSTWSSRWYRRYRKVSSNCCSCWTPRAARPRPTSLRVIPHFAYARSDKKDAPRISIGARLVADLLATAGATRVLTMALHAPQVHGFFSVPVDHLSAIKVLAEHFRSYNLSNAVVVSPDLGNAKMAAALARVLGVPVAAGSKQRLTDDTVIIDRIIGDVHNREVIVLDDEIATAGSIVELLKLLRAERAGQISVACTHGLFTGPAIERLKQEPDIAEIVTTNTVPLPPGEPAAQQWLSCRLLRCSRKLCTGSMRASRSAASSATS